MSIILLNISEQMFRIIVNNYEHVFNSFLSNSDQAQNLESGHSASGLNNSGLLISDPKECFICLSI